MQFVSGQSVKYIIRRFPSTGSAAGHGKAFGSNRLAIQVWLQGYAPYNADAADIASRGPGYADLSGRHEAPST